MLKYIEIFAQADANALISISLIFFSTNIFKNFMNFLIKEKFKNIKKFKFIKSIKKIFFKWLNEHLIYEYKIDVTLIINCI